jgi:hypothetical protein
VVKDSQSTTDTNHLGGIKEKKGGGKLGERDGNCRKN